MTHGVHFVLQGKGGVGKSVVASLLAQFLTDSGKVVQCIDTDPINTSLLDVSSLNVAQVNLMHGSTLVEREFDKMMEIIFATEGEIVVDNGASSSIPLANYLKENDAFQMIADSGRQVCVHTVITGGAALLHTLAGFQSLAIQVQGVAQLYVWVNDALEEVERNGKRFEDMKAYVDHKHLVTGVIRLARHTASTYGEDMKGMLERKQTFADALASDIGIMTKQRLTTLQKRIYGSIGNAL